MIFKINRITTFGEEGIPIFAHYSYVKSIVGYPEEITYMIRFWGDCMSYIMYLYNDWSIYLENLEANDGGIIGLIITYEIGNGNIRKSVKMTQLLGTNNDDYRMVVNII